MRYKLTLYFSFLFLTTYSQVDDYFIINNIHYLGNDKTKDRVIDKELDAQVGDIVYLKDLAKWKEYSEKRILGTALFTAVELNIVNWDFESKKADIEITLRENLYVYPIPILEVADRSFNVWLFEMDRDLKRINYGLELEHINFTGNKDKLKFKFQRGYTNKYELLYRYPYLYDNVGLNFEISYADYDEIGYKTYGNKTLFGSSADNEKLLTRFRVGQELTYRQDTKIFHGLKLTYHQNTIDQYVVDNLTTEYFIDGETELKMFTLDYSFTYDNRLFNFYPTGGWLGSILVSKEGLGLFNDYNNLRLKAQYQYFYKVTDEVTTGVRLAGSTKIMKDNIPFANNTGLGYEDDLIRGYELYVVDGSDYVLGKLSTRYKIFEKSIDLKKWMVIKKLRIMPTEINIRFNLESGYVYEKRYLDNNTLNNKWLVGYGPAVDLIIYNTFLFSVEYNFNSEGENGLFLKSSSNF